ncbi:LysR family transcriptional regulator [Neptunomonas antarctica]|uniref:Transcriptional regulator, LysR family n=1 Tax=Neptunomonas antarctica TaxID=619304 RepID=A0A1N7IYH0_9GAMM|nr:LysR family transcriptional regulator [Neptunomonas antarctica]SIS42094.1 transcriptional regulator, LysR family [Neptunomonas antarctica]
MDRFHLMSVFVAVADEEGFAAAARRLRMSPPAVTRAISALEEHLGVKLLNRTTRYVRTSDAGQRYLEDARRILAEVDSADEAAAGINAEPHGHLAVTAPALFGRKFITPGIVDYLQRYPNTEVSAVFLDRVVNLLEEGLDVGIRIGELPDSSMRALRVGSVRRVICASPEYLQQHGQPQTPDDLLQHTIIASSAISGSLDWRLNTAEGKPIRIKPRLTVNTNDAALEAALEGFGVTRLLSYQVNQQLASGALVRILETYEPAAWPVHIIHREGRYASAKIRTFVDLMAERLRADSSLNWFK